MRFYNNITTSSESGCKEQRAKSTLGISRRTSWTHLVANPSHDLNVQNLWHRLLGDYSRLALSDEKDRLPAIGAIAEMFHRHQRPDEQYLAGLWSGSFLHDLLWFKSQPPRGFSHTEPGQNAPSLGLGWWKSTAQIMNERTTE